MRPGSKDIGERLESPFLDEAIRVAAAEPEVPVASQDEEEAQETDVSEACETERDDQTSSADPGVFEFDTVRPTQPGAVTLLLDEPVETDDAFQLVRHDGTYKKTLRASDAKPLVTGERVLRFERVSPTKRYTLIHQRSKKSRRPVFLAMPFNHLTSAGHGPRTARNTYVTLPSQVPRQLPNKHGTDRPVDADLIAPAPVLVDLAVEDPKV